MIPSWYPTPEDERSGVFFRDQAEALSRRGAKVGVVYPDLRSLRSLTRGSPTKNHWQVETDRQNDVTVMRLAGWNPGTARLRARAFLSGAGLLLRRYAESFRLPDVIHAQSCLWAGVSAAEARVRLGVPYVVTEHSSAFSRKMLSPWERQRAGSALERASLVLAVSGSLAAILGEMFPGTVAEVVPNMVDTEFFAPPPLGRPESSFTFLAVGSLLPLKGYDLLIRAFARAFAGVQGVSLRIAGSGPELRALERLASQEGLQGKLAFLGPLSRVQVRNEMWRADALVLSSLTETFGLVVAEAQATGLPVVATRCGGPEDILTPSTGLLVETGDVLTLSDGMSAVYHERWRWKEQADSISESAARRFGSAQVADRLLECYERVQG